MRPGIIYSEINCVMQRVKATTLSLNSALCAAVLYPTMLCKQLWLCHTVAAHHGFTTAYKWSTNIILIQCFSSIPIRCDSVHMDKYGRMLHVIPGRAKIR